MNYLNFMICQNIYRQLGSEERVMGVMRVNKTKNYTVMSNYHLSDKKISLRAKGLLSLMLSLPDDWNYSIAGLTKYTKDGKDAIMTILKELEDNNYLVRTQLTNDKGQFAGYDYDIYEVPQMEKPYTEKPNTDKPNTDSPTLLNTNNTNIINNNTNKINTNNVKEIQKKKTDADFIYDYYLDKSIEFGYAQRRISATDTTMNNIKRYLREYSLDTMKETIDRYFEVINDNNYFFNTYWNAEKFFRQSNTFKDFLEDGNKWINYLKFKKSKPKQDRYNSNKLENQSNEWAHDFFNSLPGTFNPK